MYSFVFREQCTSKHKILLRVWRAMQIRGLISTDMSFPLLWEKTLELKQCQFRDLLLDAVRKTKDIFSLLSQQNDQSEGDSAARAF